MRKNENILKPLKCEKIIKHTFKRGWRINKEMISAIILFIDKKINLQDNATTPKEVHYLVKISKRTARKAVMRNRIKRLLRESLVISARSEEYEHLFYSIDNIILTWKIAPKHKGLIRLKDVEPEVVKVLLQASEYFKKMKGQRIENGSDPVN
jgi:ribonuclease P protein component